MPRGQKSKLRAREKRQQKRDQSQAFRGPQATAEKEEEGPSSSPPTSCSSPVSRGGPPSSPAVFIPLGSQGAPRSSSPDAGVACAMPDEDAKSQDEETPSTSQAASSTQSSQKDPLTRKASMLVQFLLEKYKKKEPILKADMLKVVNRKYKEHFPEILKRACERMELVFGLELKGVKPGDQLYTLVSKLGLSTEGCVSGNGGLPKSGLLMTLLGVIFMKGNRATEEEVWEFLNALGVYAGRRHLIFGEPRKFITKDLVQEKYLEYRQVPNSDPPSYEFLWGPRARAETSKMKVLEVLAKINNTVPTSFPSLYDEALRDEQERAAVRAAARAGTAAQARARFGAMSLRPPHI
ncbi:melanoma-associated antigen B1-like [Microcebus murinus]|uniref:melanoma-associated antigen B1-like n=1 Tax=Microcebus murinus TaxID=30608 RepID=UPI000643B914|nr:melanoma-associated antigen B1-like [Microcebus murinus]XP_012612331.1 melanoma-associated antigen B1-like [Microcebus murinus]